MEYGSRQREERSIIVSLHAAIWILLNMFRLIQLKQWDLRHVRSAIDKHKDRCIASVLPFPAAGRTRTGMVSRLILSQVRLPIPPQRHNVYFYSINTGDNQVRHRISIFIFTKNWWNNLRYMIYLSYSGYWRSWERATLAVWRSRVRVPYTPLF